MKLEKLPDRLTGYFVLLYRISLVLHRTKLDDVVKNRWFSSENSAEGFTTFSGLCYLYCGIKLEF